MVLVIHAKLLNASFNGLLGNLDKLWQAPVIRFEKCCFVKALPFESRHTDPTSTAAAQ